jgi:hypothetical protein
MRGKRCFREQKLLRGLLIVALLFLPLVAYATVEDDPSLPVAEGLIDQCDTSDSFCFDESTVLCGEEGIARRHLIALPATGTCEAPASQIQDLILSLFPQCPRRGPPAVTLTLLTAL